MPQLTRPLVFVKYFDKGSTVLGAHQMTEILGGRGIECRTVYAKELGGVRDSTLIFIKKGDLRHLTGARLRNNLSVLDVQDTLCHKRGLKFKPLYHGIMFRSQKPLDDYGTGDDRSVNIFLQWNASYKPNTVANDGFKLAYLGDPRSFSYWNQIPEVPCIGEVGFFEEATKYNCHISIRTAPRDVLYKPTCKVSTAAICEANLITTRDEGSLEILGEDYPYYTDPDADSIRKAIDYARETYGGAIWQAGLEKMKEVKRTHALEVIADRYVDYLSRLEARYDAK